MFWSVGFTLIVLIALAALSFMLFIVDAIGYGGVRLLSADPTLSPPNPDTFTAAFAISALAALAFSLLLAHFAGRTSLATWSPVLQGLVAALAAGVAAYVTLTLMLQINPIDLLVDLIP